MSEVWPQVASIEITEKEAYRHAFGEPFVKEYTLGFHAAKIVAWKQKRMLSFVLWHK